jgi:hypothetical protein
MWCVGRGGWQGCVQLGVRRSRPTRMQWTLAKYDKVDIFSLHISCKTETVSKLFIHPLNPW